MMALTVADGFTSSTPGRAAVVALSVTSVDRADVRRRSLTDMARRPLNEASERTE